MIDSGPFIRRLQDRVEELEAELSVLKASLGALDGNEDAHRLGLTINEARIYNALKRRKIATRDQLIFALYPDDPDRRAERDPHIVRVTIGNIRKKGIPIATKRGVGWWLEQPQAAE